MILILIIFQSSTNATKKTFTGCAEQIGGSNYQVYKGPGGYFYQRHLNEHGVLTVEVIGGGLGSQTSEFLAQNRCNLLAALSPN